MFFSQVIAGLTVVGIVIITLIAAPIVLLLAIRARWLNIGLTTATTEQTQADRTRINDLKPDERVVTVTSPNRSRWQILFLSGMLIILIGWSIPLIVRVVAITLSNQSHWWSLLLYGTMTIPIGWGIPLIVYALRVRKRPQYVFTDQRLLVVTRDETDTVPLDEVSQVQGGVSPLESIVNRGHVTFRIGETQLETISYLSNVNELVDAIIAAQADASPTERTAERKRA